MNTSSLIHIVHWSKNQGANSMENYSFFSHSIQRSNLAPCGSHSDSFSSVFATAPLPLQTPSRDGMATVF